MMVIKAMAHGCFLVFSFEFTVFVVILLLETLAVSLDTSLLLVTTFLLQDFFIYFLASSSNSSYYIIQFYFVGQLYSD